MNRVILTGATGYLGRKILESLIAQGFSVTCLVRRKDTDLSSMKNVQVVDVSTLGWQGRVMPATTLIHCATSYGRNGETAAEISAANIDFPKELLSHCPKWQVQTWVNTHTALPASLNRYAKSKSAWLEIFRQSNLKVKINLVLEQFYGPGESSWQFVTWLARTLLAGQDSIPLTSGEQQRNFIYIDDLVRVFDKVVSSAFSEGFHEFHVSALKNTLIKDLAMMVAEQCGESVNRLRFGALPYRENEVMKSERAPGLVAFPAWEPQVSLLEGVSRVVDFEKHKLSSASKNL